MELHVNLHGEQCHVETSGGEGWIDKDYAVGEYGFQIGDIGIYGLLPGVLVDLVIKAANHLMICGHKFSLRVTADRECQEIKYEGRS